MVDSQDRPAWDGLDHLFGDSAFDVIIGGHSAPPSNASLPSRRDLRTTSKSSKPASRKPANSRATSRKAARSTRPAPPPAFVKPLDSAYPEGRVIVVRRAPVARKKKRGSGFLTILAVVGLFGSVALPAYALAPKPSTDSSASVFGADGTDVALSVADTAAVPDAIRGEFKATTAEELRNQRRTSFMAENFAAYMASGARELGDDYPWFSELSNNQGGGSSPLNYFYRECVDFAAWRLNRDAGYTSAPFLYTWTTLTPTGGNAYQWKYAWTKKGWPTSTTPIAGSIAWYNYGHVAYVKTVNSDGTMVIEDYNQSGLHLYDQRVVPVTDAQLYLYPPPR